MTTFAFPPPIVAPAPEPLPPARARWARLPLAAFVGVLALSLILNCWGLAQNGLGNTYYAAAARSMSEGWRNFFFNALDPGGFISVDKPPVALWIEALSVRIFGYSSWALLLPSAALAGTGSVAILWCAVRRRFGAVAAFVAALALAVSPINVAVNRLNLPDPFMILFLVAAVWAVLRSLDSARWTWWLILAGGFVGLAFNTKMLAAAIAIPALAIAVAIGSRGSLGARFLRLVVLGAACLAFSVPWMVAVDLTPASARPYVGGSTDNTLQDLIVGYNGLGRVDGDGQGGAGRGGPAGGRFGGGAGAGGIFGGEPGTGRLFSDAVGGQIAWLIPLAAAGAALAIWRFRRDHERLAHVALWTTWAVTFGVVFSYAQGTFHSYYTSAMMPGLAALVGIGGVALVALAREHRAWWAAGAVAIAATVGLQLVVTDRVPDFHGWVRPVLVVLALGAIAGLVAALVWPRARRAALVGLGVGLAALLIAPSAWAASEANNAVLNASLPQAGPRTGLSGNTFGSAAFGADAGLAEYLKSQRAGQRWDLATSSAQTASGLIAQQDLSVMALGGFLGTDPAATTASIAARVTAGEIRFFLTGGHGGGGFGGFGGGGLGGGGFQPTPGGGAGVRPGAPAAPAPARGGAAPTANGRQVANANQILAAVAQVCAPVTAASTGGALPREYSNALYDCQGRGPALAQLAGV